MSHFEDDSYETIGYSIARQAPNGLIHIIATATLPLVHFEINEAWILQVDADWSLLYESDVSDFQEFSDFYPSGALKAVRHGGVSRDG